MADTLVTLKGSIPINNHKLLGPADPQQRIEVTIKLRRKTERGLPTLKEFVAGKRAKGITRQILAEKLRREPRGCDHGPAMGRATRSLRFTTRSRQATTAPRRLRQKR